jgi:very-short-patch-repair endonuclease
MAGKSDPARSAAAWQLARDQHGVVARRQLLAIGFSSKAIAHRLETGRLRPIRRGVYTVELPRGGDEQRWMGAVLACGDDAALSHRSAAALWGIGQERWGVIDVSVRLRSPRRAAGVKVRRRLPLADADLTRHRGIPVTIPARTILDMATEVGLGMLERTVNEADKRDLVDPEALRGALDGYPGEPGVRVLRGLLDRLTFRLSDTDLEVLFRPIAAAAGLPVPLTKQWVNGFEVDFYWPDLGLVVETDGLRYHRTASAQNRDLLRDQTHVAAGLTRLRFSHYQVKFEAARVRTVLSATAARLGQAAPKRRDGRAAH